MNLRPRFLLKETTGRIPLRRFSGQAVWIALALFVLAMGPAHLLATSSAAAGQPETTIPQGENPPGTDDGLPEPLPPGEHKGVIEPPDIGDEGIHTEVPSPDAGHEEEVIPPSELPEQTPNTQTR
jgi:hypothetical protein